MYLIKEWKLESILAIIKWAEYLRAPSNPNWKRKQDAWKVKHFPRIKSRHSDRNQINVLYDSLCLSRSVWSLVMLARLQQVGKGALMKCQSQLSVIHFRGGASGLPSLKVWFLIYPDELQQAQKGFTLQSYAQDERSRLNFIFCLIQTDLIICLLK